MKNKKIIILLPIFVIVLAVIFLFRGSKAIESTSLTRINDINYEESLRELKNPERGFYEPMGLNLQESNNRILNPNNNLVHLRVGIGAFSSKVNGRKDLEFTEDMLNALDQTLKNIKNNGGTVILRFAYDNFNGKKDLEPSLSMILRHIEQLKEIFTNNQDVIAYIELGFFGPWGEMHSSKVSSTENVSKALDVMLSIVPDKIKIGVRTPNYYAAWSGLDRDKLNENITVEGEKYYRVGLFNDGYLGSESDLGTFKNRDIEVAWLSNQAKHTFYGGEVVANFASGTPLNTVEYISKEGFLTHTTYLNLRWNYTVIDDWKNTTYNGEDTLYKGQTGFTYINNHLGYRYVLKSSSLTQNIHQGSMLQGKLNVENVGFANLINEKKATIVLTNGTNTYEINTNIDARTWESQKINEVNFSVSLPNNIALGKWLVYLRLSEYGKIDTDNNYKCIEFANEDIYDKTLGANYIGSININKKTTTTTSSSSKTTTTNLTTTTKKVNDNDIIYIEPSDNANEVDIKKPTTTTKPTTKPTTTVQVTIPKKTTTTTTMSTTSKVTQNISISTTKKISSTTTNKITSQELITSSQKKEESKENKEPKVNGNSQKLRGILVLLFAVIIIALILICHKKD